MIICKIHFLNLFYNLIDYKLFHHYEIYSMSFKCYAIKPLLLDTLYNVTCQINKGNPLKTRSPRVFHFVTHTRQNNCSRLKLDI